MVARSEMDSNPCCGQLVGRREIIVEFLAGSGSLDCSLWLSLSKVGHFRTSHVSWVLCKLSDVEEGPSEVEDDHGSPCRETGYQGHELFGLDGASIRGCKDLHGSTSATRCCGVNLKVLDAKAGWIQEDESKLLLRKALFSVERGKDESLRQYTTRRLAQIEAASAAALVTMPTTTLGTVLKEGARVTKQSQQNLNTLLNGSTEVDDVARALNMLDVESQEGIIKAAVKPVVHSFMETGKFSESQPCEEETDEPNDQSDEEEELCPPVEETMVASWIAQIGEEGLSETEALDSFVAMNEQRKRTWAQAQELKKAARKDRGFFSSRAAVRHRANGSRQLRQSTRRSSNPMDGDGTPKDLRARLRRENTCFRCMKKGHWKAECPEKQHNKDGTAPAVFSGLTFLHTVNEESVWSAATWSGQPVRRGRGMGNGIPRNPSGTLHSGQCCRTSVDWRSCMCQMGAKVEQCWSMWCTSSLQDDDTKRCGRYSTSYKIDDDAHYD